MHTDLHQALLRHQSEFSSVVPFDGKKEKIISFDFTDKNRELSVDILNDIDKFCRYIDKELEKQDARYGIGGYAEHRTIYSRSALFDAEWPGEEPRRFHLGLDIWGKAGTPVMAPWEGYVHSFAFNDHKGDYGTTIILEHSLEDISFFTLYGHLDLASIRHLKEGNKISKGERIAAFGIPGENGHWPPHLHFQVIKDLQGYKGDYPGVCKYSERNSYLANCPDPRPVTRLINKEGRKEI